MTTRVNTEFRVDAFNAFNRVNLVGSGHGSEQLELRQGHVAAEHARHPARRAGAFLARKLGTLIRSFTGSGRRARLREFRYEVFLRDPLSGDPRPVWSSNSAVSYGAHEVAACAAPRRGARHCAARPSSHPQRPCRGRRSSASRTWRSSSAICRRRARSTSTCSASRNPSRCRSPTARSRSPSSRSTIGSGSSSSTGRSAGEGQLNHIAIYTDNADAMRDYLSSQGVAVPERVPKGRTGNKNFMVKDPDGHDVEIVEYQPDSWTAKDAGHHIPADASLEHAMHVGILVGNLEASMKFYNGDPGLPGILARQRRELEDAQLGQHARPRWHGLHRAHALRRDARARPARLRASPLPRRARCRQGRRGARRRRPARASYTRPVEIRTGINRKRQVNLFDPDGTRVELMEPNTIDGKPAPSSTLPPPR